MTAEWHPGSRRIAWCRAQHPKLSSRAYAERAIACLQSEGALNELPKGLPELPPELRRKVDLLNGRDPDHEAQCRAGRIGSASCCRAGADQQGLYSRGWSVARSQLMDGSERRGAA